MNHHHHHTPDPQLQNHSPNSPTNTHSPPTTPSKPPSNLQHSPEIDPPPSQHPNPIPDNCLAIDKFLFQDEQPLSEEEVFIFPEEESFDEESEEDEEVWEIDRDDHQVRQFYVSEEGEENNYSSESDSESPSSEEEEWKRGCRDYDEDDEDNDSLFQVPKKKKCASFYYQDYLSLNCYTDMTPKQKKKYFNEINKNYFESLEIQEHYKKLSRESQARFEKNNNLPPMKQKKSVSFSDVLKVKTFSKESCPEEVKNANEEEQKILRNIWQFDEQ